MATCILLQIIVYNVGQKGKTDLMPLSFLYLQTLHDYLSALHIKQYVGIAESNM